MTRTWKAVPTLILTAAIVAMAAPAGAEKTCAQEKDCSQPMKESKLLMVLPEGLCNTPDAMCMLPCGSFILSVPNFNDTKLPPVLLKISPKNKAALFCKLPDNPETGKPFGALGVCLAPCGDLFVADFQAEGERKSRVARVVVKDGKAVKTVPVVTGFGVSNAVKVRDGYLYVTDTMIEKKEGAPSISGLFRFKLDDLRADKPVKLADELLQDPHLVATIECHDEFGLGADGLCFDTQGNIYIGNFADGTVHKLVLNKQGKVRSNVVFAKAPFMKCCDGMDFDPETETIYVADSIANAIHAVSLDGKVRVLAQSGDTDGMDGGMDQPCEPMLRGREVIVSNMDWPIVPDAINQKYNKPATLSVIELEE